MQWLLGSDERLEAHPGWDLSASRRSTSTHRPRGDGSVEWVANAVSPGDIRASGSDLIRSDNEHVH